MIVKVGEVVIVQESLVEDIIQNHQPGMLENRKRDNKKGWDMGFWSPI